MTRFRISIPADPTDTPYSTSLSYYDVPVGLSMTSRSKIPFERVGKIALGFSGGQFLKIIEGEKDTGGVFLLISSTKEMRDGGNIWIEKEEDLPDVFKQYQWKIIWL